MTAFFNTSKMAAYLDRQSDGRRIRAGRLCQRKAQGCQWRLQRSSSTSGASNATPTLSGSRIDRSYCDVSELVQCILLEIHPLLVYLSIDKFAEASP
jgi:hypothetical protein